MPRLSDIQDAEVRGALEAVDALIGEGDYTAASRKAVDAYLLIVERHPDLVPPPAAPNQAPQFTTTLPANRSRGGGVAGGLGRPGWPNQGGIRVLFDESGAPGVSYEKQRFSLSEASTYFEFVLEEAVRANP